MRMPHEALQAYKKKPFPLELKIAAFFAVLERYIIRLGIIQELLKASKRLSDLIQKTFLRGTEGEMHSISLEDTVKLLRPMRPSWNLTMKACLHDITVVSLFPDLGIKIKTLMRFLKVSFRQLLKNIWNYLEGFLKEKLEVRAGSTGVLLLPSWESMGKLLKLLKRPQKMNMKALFLGFAKESPFSA